MVTADGLTQEQDAEAVYVQLATILRRKYGSATAHDVKQGVYLTLKSYDWIHGQTNVNLTYMHSSKNGASVVNVNYRSTVDADQL